MNKAPKFSLQAALVLIFPGSAMPLHAQLDVWVGSDLSICNKGTVPVEVVAANKRSGLQDTWWDVTGATKAPGECATVTNRDEEPSYIAFGLSDAKGGIESGVIAQVPDFGSDPNRSILVPEEKVLIGAAKRICARTGVTLYSWSKDLTTDCSALTMSGLGPEYGKGPFLPLTAALYFHVQPHNCRNSQITDLVPCETTHYYLNIYPGVKDGELHATAGTKGGADAAAQNASDLEAAAQMLKALNKAMADEREKQAKAAADATAAKERQLRDQAATRQEKQKQILAADAAGDPNVKVEAQMIRRDEADNQQRWAGTRQSPGAWDPQWMRQNMVIVGTVSRVEIDTRGSPQWVTIYFKESPDGTFVACSPYADLFEERVGLNLNAMVGKTLEAAGAVEPPMCGPKAAKNSIRVVESRQWQVR